MHSFDGVGPEARRVAVAVLEVLGGVRSPSEAAEALGVSAPRYYALESRALSGLVKASGRRPRGPRRSAERECVRLRREVERLKRECARLQALVRLSQRTVGTRPRRGEAPEGPGEEAPAAAGDGAGAPGARVAPPGRRGENPREERAARG